MDSLILWTFHHFDFLHIDPNLKRILKFDTTKPDEGFTHWGSLNQGRYHHSCVLINGKILVVGGMEATTSGYVQAKKN